jgi:hypothetical protein
MDKIKFTFEETNEDVVFAILGSVQYNEYAYLMVVDEKELNDEDMTAYILKAIEIDNEDIIYEIVDDESELDEVMNMFDDVLDNYELNME